MIFSSSKVADRFVHFVSRLAFRPVLADFAYGRIGRLAAWGIRHSQWCSARIFRVPIERFKRNYFYPKRVLQLNLTNVCNARCSFCAYRIVADTDRTTGVMKWEVFKKAADEYSSLGGTSVDLTPTVGDPLLDPAIIDKIRYCREKTGINDITLTTNAIAITKRELYKQLVDSGVTTIAISLPGLDAKTYKEVYGVDRYPEVIKGIAMLLGYNQQQHEPVRIILRFRNPEKPSALIRSKDFIEHIKPYLSDMVTCNFTVDYDNWGGAITEKDMYGVMKLRKVPPRYNVPCANLFTFMVRHDGSVRLCGCRLKNTEDDDLVVGNLRDSSLQEIGRNEKMHKIIEGFYHGARPATCEKCSFYNPLLRKQTETFVN